ncbi:MAG TPA: hypothetical protein VIL00_07220 [Pseudonocardiaceae bacterium]
MTATTVPDTRRNGGGRSCEHPAEPYPSPEVTVSSLPIRLSTEGVLAVRDGERRAAVLESWGHSQDAVEARALPWTVVNSPQDQLDHLADTDVVGWTPLVPAEDLTGLHAEIERLHTEVEQLRAEPDRPRTLAPDPSSDLQGLAGWEENW